MSYSTMKEKIEELENVIRENHVKLGMHQQRIWELTEQFKKHSDRREDALDMALAYRAQRDTLIGFIEGFREDNLGKPEERTRLDDFLDMMRTEPDSRFGNKSGLAW